MKAWECPSCDAAFQAGSCDGEVCPACGGGELAEGAEAEPIEAERLLPFAMSPEALGSALAPFVKLRFATSDLTAANLAARARPIAWPVWLFDCRLESAWEAEVGFDEQVKSSDEELHGGAWRSVERMRTRVRWERRAGSLSRRYDNVRAPALRGHARRWEALGGYAIEAANEPSPRALSAAWTQLPDRPRDDAWRDAVDGVAHRAGEEVRHASGAEHLRGFAVAGEPSALAHTWLLLPAYATWYRDDDGVRHPVLVHGITGKAAGRRMASVKRGVGWSVGLGLVGVGLLALAGVVALIGLPLLAAAGAGALFLTGAGVIAVVALVPLVGALWPPLSAWAHNRAERARPTVG